MTFHTQRPTSTVERRGPWQETALHCLSNNNHLKKKRQKNFPMEDLVQCALFLY